MPVLVTAKILVVDKPIKRGNEFRIYRRSTVRKAIDTVKNQILDNGILGFYLRTIEDLSLMEKDQTFRVNLQNASHLLTNLELIDDTVLATVRTLDTIPGKMLDAAIKTDSILFRPTGLGRVNGSNEVYFYEFDTVNAYAPSMAAPL